MNDTNLASTVRQVAKHCGIDTTGKSTASLVLEIERTFQTQKKIAEHYKALATRSTRSIPTKNIEVSEKIVFGGDLYGADHE